MTAATLQDAVDALHRLNCQPIKTADGFDAFCPLHEADGKSHKRSLGVKAGDTVPVVVNCRAGCSGPEILKALGLNGTARKSASIIATYRYQDADGRDVREKLRYDPKDFRIRHRDAAGNLVYKSGDGPAVLYRLPELKAAIEQGRTVFVVEGEKDADRLAALGLVATTNIEGAAKPSHTPKWKPEYTAQLSGAARVVLVPDNDEPGKAHMKHVAAKLAGKVAEVRCLELPGLPHKGDVSDWLNAGKSVEELKALVNDLPEPATTPSRFKMCDMKKVWDAALDPPQFIIESLVPRDHLTLFGGHGGSGKTTVAMVMGAHVACGRDWAGLRVKRGRVLLVSFEDREDLLLWRLRNIAEEYALNLNEIMENMTVIDATEASAIMCESHDAGIRAVIPTHDGEELMGLIRKGSYNLTIIDNTSDAFDGDENNRRQVRHFLRYLTGAIRAHNGALLLLAHIDKTAARYGAGKNSYSGSTGWHNGPRSRLALANDELRQEKLNVGKPLHEPIALVWTKIGVPVCASSTGAEPAQSQANGADDAALLACFAAAAEAGATVSDSETGPATTWHSLTVYPECPKPLRENKARFKQGIARLLRSGMIRREQYRNDNRKIKVRLALAEQSECANLRQSAPVIEPAQTSAEWRAPVRQFGVGGMGDILAHSEPAQTGANSADSNDDLAVELGKLAGLDAGRMLRGELTEADWPRINDATARLSEQRPDVAEKLAALVARIDSAYSGSAKP